MWFLTVFLSCACQNFEILLSSHAKADKTEKVIPTLKISAAYRDSFASDQDVYSELKHWKIHEEISTANGGWA